MLDTAALLSGAAATLAILCGEVAIWMYRVENASLGSPAITAASLQMPFVFSDLPRTGAVECRPGVDQARGGGERVGDMPDRVASHVYDTLGSIE